MTVLTEAPETYLLFIGKIMTVPTEAPETYLLFNGNIMTVPTEAPETYLLFNGKIMTVTTETLGNLPTIQLQDNDSSDRSTWKPAYYSMAR